MGSCCETDRKNGAIVVHAAPTPPATPALDSLHFFFPPSTPCSLPDSSIPSLQTPFSNKYLTAPSSPVARTSTHRGEGHGLGHSLPTTPRGNKSSFKQEIPIKKLTRPIETIYQLTATVHADKATSVFVAKHLQTGIDRLIKRVEKIKRVKGPSRNNQDRLRREVEMLSRLDHPNILKLYELYEDKLYFYLVSEALTGGYLLDYLDREKNLSEQLAAKVILQVMKALVYCHSRGVLHRNLRMESLLVQSSSTSGNVHVIVLDFGAAVMMSSQDKEASRTDSAIYTAPEAIANEPTEAADVWSCGVILHMLLCGEPPFNGGSARAIYTKIASRNVVFPQGLWEGVSSEAINLLRGMLNKDPAARLSLADCLSHPWIRTNVRNESCSSKPIVTALRNLKTFESKKKLKRTILSFIAAHIDSQEETKALRDAFMSVDINGDGLLSRDELIQAYSQTMSVEEAAYVAEKVLRDVDSDHSGYVDYSEFLLAGKNNKLLLTPRNLRAIFLLFDSNDNGKVTFSEFKNGLKRYNLSAAESIWETLLAVADVNHDGELSCAEFSRLLLAAVDMDEKQVRR